MREASLLACGKVPFGELVCGKISAPESAVREFQAWIHAEEWGELALHSSPSRQVEAFQKIGDMPPRLFYGSSAGLAAPAASIMNSIAQTGTICGKAEEVAW